MATINVKDSSGSVVAIEKPLAPARAAATASRPVVLSNEDKTALDLVASNLTGGTAIAKDGGPGWTTVWGVSGLPYTSADRSGSAAPVSDAPTSGQKLVIDDILISVDTAMAVTLKCETSGAVVAGPFYLPVNGTLQITTRGKGKKLATADKKLHVQTSAAGNIMVDVGYHSEA